MTSIQAAHSHGFPASMAEDNMEIYSDFGQNIGDDDIDIDIDLAAGQNEEDYILEDAKSDIGLDGNYVIETLSPQGASNDEPMVDDERASYAMDDVDFVPEDNSYDQEADAGVPGMGTSSLDVGHNDAQDGTAPEAAWDHIRESEDSLQYAGKQESSTKDTTTFEDKGEEVQVPAVISPTPPPLHEVLTEDDGDQQAVPLTREHNSNSNAYYGKEVPSEVGNEPDEDNTATQENHEPRSQPDQEEKEIPALINALVAYRDAEYALISSSDSDDPDSFFFKDDTLTKMPFSTFFNALRDVLIDDLALEDELYLAFEELGLEITETSTVVHDVTFSQVIDLRNSLMQNDGIERPEIVYVTLGTKTNFAKRLATLTAGVAEGKGLSEFVPWEEVSESFGEIEESENFTGHVVEPPEENFDHKITPVPAEATNVKSVDPVVTEDRSHAVTSDGLLESKTDDVADPNKGVASDLSHEDRGGRRSIPSQEQGEVNLQGYESTPPKIDTIAQQDDLDEDGDLIDYEDEEYEQTHGKHVPVGSTAEDGNLDTKNGINIVRRQRSNSPATEEADTQQPVSPDYSVTEESTVDTQGHPGKTSGHDAQDNEAVIGLDDQQAKIKSGTMKDHQYVFDPDDSRTTDDGVEHSFLPSDIPGEEPDENQASEENIYLGDLEFNGLDYGHYDNEIGDILDSQVSDVQNPDSERNEGEAKDANEEISYEEIFETFDSNDSEGTITTDYQPQKPTASVPEETQDEINYEDDDNLLNLTPIPEAQATPIALTGNGSAGKRTRSETEVVDRSNKELKRART